MQTFFQKNRNEITITPVSGSNKTKEDIVMLVSVLHWIYPKKIDFTLISIYFFLKYVIQLFKLIRAQGSSYKFWYVHFLSPRWQMDGSLLFACTPQANMTPHTQMIFCLVVNFRLVTEAECFLECSASAWASFGECKLHLFKLFLSSQCGAFPSSKYMKSSRPPPNNALAWSVDSLLCPLFTFKVYLVGVIHKLYL